MRLRVTDRILAAVAGILLLAGCAGIVAQLFFDVDMVGFAAGVFSSENVKIRAALISLGVIMLLVGCYFLLMLFRHRKRKDKFILQKNESGELAISVKALENMVNKCLDQHPEIQVNHLFLENHKDGLLIRIRGGVAGGVSIPLTVESVQRQIKQYVTACSGVEVKSIRVQIESSEEESPDAPFAIAPPTAHPLLKEENIPQAKVEEPPVVASASVETVAASHVQGASPAAVPETAPVVQPPVTETRPDPVPVEDVDEDDRPLHQRLFSPKSEPFIIPEPPVKEEGTEETDGATADDESVGASSVPEEEKENETVANDDVDAPSEEVPTDGEATTVDIDEPALELKSSETEHEVSADATSTETTISDSEKEMERQAFKSSQKLFDKLISRKGKGGKAE